MNALSTLSEMPLTKAECKVFANMAIEETLSGNREPLGIDIQLKALEDTIKLIRKDKRYKECIQKEADKYPEKSFKFKDINITKKSKTNYNYDACNDSVYNKLKKDLEEREIFLKSLKTSVANIDNGEIINPPVKTYSNYLQIEL